ncbi:hypothetical protein N7466_002402 [Penicillium verhagenii]|uniref:uncharacterized protein n=1 Tax=Penicillium verhagenii TaxID=1562060 RepID=UPI002544ED0F|nr:uncharacterized protein N7466_002402 [Penicillium verhagenii]KAJ5939268.1 hypothetical protein N7466_002402 [Penicillium verhagenii]
MNLTTRAQAKRQSKSQSPKQDPKAKTPKAQKEDSPRSSSASRKKSSEIADTKAKRTRTGCLTCRERHLKCDEALGRCLNCRKSDRICRRGVRLNFIDIQTVEPPHIIARANGAKLTFRDDSRIIASEYVGGFEKYPPPQPDSPIQERRQVQQEALNLMGPDQLASLFQSVAHSFDPGFDISHSATTDFLFGSDTWHDAHLVPGDELLPHGTSHFAQKLSMKQYSVAYLTDPEQISLLQLFVEEVGPWIDSMDSMRHFTQILPLHAIDEPLLLKALVACGARHASLADPSYGEEKVSHYYDAANQGLLHSLQDPDRDSVLCATVALLLSIYEMMSSQPLTKHTSGSRALVRECGWTAKTPSLGGSCFWVSVSMEVLHCLNYTCPLSWNPDTWGVDMHMDQVQPFWKGDDQWLHRIIYICAKIVNFRVSTQYLQTLNDPSSQNTQIHNAVQEWNHYNAWCEQWINSTPRSMKPISSLQPWQTESASTFPKIWLLKRPATISQYFYHVACIVLARAHPLSSSLHLEMNKMQQVHAYNVCGLAANLKDRSLSNISIQCLTIAAESLDARNSQEEVLNILDLVTKDTHWHSEPIKERLKGKWGWSHPETVDPAHMHNSFYDLDPALPIHGGAGISSGITNPLLDSGDFSMENHPYQGYYVAPHHRVPDHYNYGSYLV